jgi:hypothetical protein
MKKINIAFYMLAVLLLIADSCSSSRQVKNQATKEEVMQAINSDNWLFKANVALSEYGNTRYLTGEYDVKLANKSLEVYLPYFGRVYTASMANQNPLNFKSTEFTYNKTEDRAGSWLITIKPADQREVQSMTFTLFESGNAQLNVTLTNRSPINFTGFVGAAR